MNEGDWHELSYNNYLHSKTLTGHDTGCIKLGGGRDTGHGTLCELVEVHGAVATGRRE
jgi:hypothetical protein